MAYRMLAVDALQFRLFSIKKNHLWGININYPHSTDEPAEDRSFILPSSDEVGIRVQISHTPKFVALFNYVSIF